MTDVSIEKIAEVRQHPDADRLEVAVVKGWQCVVPKGFWHAGDEALYVRTDAEIRKNHKPDWAEACGIRKYLGRTGRVRSVNLRGVISQGILLKLGELPLDDDWMHALDARGELAAALGIGHYIPPPPHDLQLLASGLPGSLHKSDEEDFQNLTDKELHIGEKALMTVKKDGSSAALYYDPSIDEVVFCTRGDVLKPECDNIYTLALRPYIKQVKWLGKHFNEPVALRGEVCGRGVNSGKCNIDAEGEPTFFMYAVHFPDNDDSRIRKGRWGSGRHFLEINKLLEDNGLQKVKEVPRLERVQVRFSFTSDGEHEEKETSSEVITITRDLLKELAKMPAEAGEGIVLNGTTFSYKVKSDDYEVKNH